jgi:hypothetical protein
MRCSLLACGIVSSLVYIAANAIVPSYFEGYDVLSQTVSELSAVGAPTRTLWLAFMVPYINSALALMWAFG